MKGTARVHSTLAGSSWTPGAIISNLNIPVYSKSPKSQADITITSILVYNPSLLLSDQQRRLLIVSSEPYQSSAQAPISKYDPQTENCNVT